MDESKIAELVKKAGGIYVGIQEADKPLVLFNDPDNDTTIAYVLEELKDLPDHVIINILNTKLLVRRLQFARGAIKVKPQVIFNLDMHKLELSKEIKTIRGMVCDIPQKGSFYKDTVKRTLDVIARLDVLEYFLNFHETKKARE